MDVIVQPPLSVSLDPYAFVDNLDEQLFVEPAAAQVVINPIEPSEIIIDSQVMPHEAWPNLGAGFSEKINPAAFSAIHQIFKQTIPGFDSEHTFYPDEVFSFVAGQQLGYPDPSQAIYSADIDIKLPAKQMIEGVIGSQTAFFAGIAYTFRPTNLAFYFRDEASFISMRNDVCQRIREEYVGNLSIITPTQSFEKMTLSEVMDTLILRHDQESANKPHSFARVLVQFIKDWCQSQDPLASGIMPFSVNQLVCPTKITFVNVERCAFSKAYRISQAWAAIKQFNLYSTTTLSSSEILKLSGIQRAQRHIFAEFFNLGQQGNDPATRNIEISFVNDFFEPFTVVPIIQRLIDKQTRVYKSHNLTMRQRRTFNVPNRRDPDNYDKPGSMKKTAYKPDLHIYLDTSGSIGVSNYRDTIRALVIMAKKLDVDIYFTSFSTVLSKEVRIPVRGRSLASIWKHIESIPKVDGGTDYEQIYNYINASTTRSQRLNLVITDFEWWPPSYRIDVPKNLYYIPISVHRWRFSNLRARAISFARNMRHHDPRCALRMLGMVK